MAKTPQRNVKRANSSGRDALTTRYNNRKWYNLPDWAKRGATDNIWWVALGVAIILLPGALLAIVTGYRELPLQYFGVPGNDSADNVSIVALILKFAFLAIAVRPLYKRKSSGWNWLVMAAAINFTHGIYLGHGVTSGFLLGVIIYLRHQTKPVYQT